MPPPDHQSKKICILRLSALGDATHVVPVVRSIQDHWPAAQISWIIGKLERRLLHGLENVEFIEFDKKSAAVNPAAWFSRRANRPAELQVT